MSNDDVIYIKKSVRNMWAYTLATTIILAIATCIIVTVTINDHTDLNRKLNTDEAYTYFMDMTDLLSRHSATWDAYMKANEIEKHGLKLRLDSLRDEMNGVIKKMHVTRGGKDYPDMFTASPRFMIDVETKLMNSKLITDKYR